MYRGGWRAGRDDVPAGDEGCSVSCIHEPGLSVATRGAGNLCLACLVGACSDARFASKTDDGVRVMILRLETVVHAAADALGRAECRARVHAEVPPSALAAIARRMAAELASPGAPPAIAEALRSVLQELVHDHEQMSAAAASQLAESSLAELEHDQGWGWVGPMEVFWTLVCRSLEARQVASETPQLFLAVMDALQGAARRAHGVPNQGTEERIDPCRALVAATRVLAVLWGDLASVTPLEAWCPAHLIPCVVPEIARAYLAAPHGAPQAAPLLIVLEAMASDPNHARTLCAPELECDPSMETGHTDGPVLVRALLRGLNADEADSQTAALSAFSSLALHCAELVQTICSFNVVEHILDAIRQSCIGARNNNHSENDVLSLPCRTIDAGLFCLSSLMSGDTDAVCARLAVGNAILGRCASLLARRCDPDQSSLMGICCSLLCGSAKAQARENGSLGDPCSLFFVFALTHECVAARDEHALGNVDKPSSTDTDTRLLAIECALAVVDLAQQTGEVVLCRKAIMECLLSIANSASVAEVDSVSSLLAAVAKHFAKDEGINEYLEDVLCSLFHACKCLLPLAAGRDDSHAIACLASAALDIDVIGNATFDTLGLVLHYMPLDHIFDQLIAGSRDEETLAAGWALMSRAHAPTRERFHPRYFRSGEKGNALPRNISSTLALAADTSDPNTSVRLIALTAIHTSLVDGMWQIPAGVPALAAALTKAINVPECTKDARAMPCKTSMMEPAWMAMEILLEAECFHPLPDAAGDAVVSLLLSSGYDLRQATPGVVMWVVQHPPLREKLCRNLEFLVTGYPHVKDMVAGLMWSDSDAFIDMCDRLLDCVEVPKEIPNVQRMLSLAACELARQDAVPKAHNRVLCNFECFAGKIFVHCAHKLMSSHENCEVPSEQNLSLAFHSMTALAGVLRIISANFGNTDKASTEVDVFSSEFTLLFERFCKIFFQGLVWRAQPEDIRNARCIAAAGVLEGQLFPDRVARRCGKHLIPWALHYNVSDPVVVYFVATTVARDLATADGMRNAKQCSDMMLCVSAAVAEGLLGALDNRVNSLGLPSVYAFCLIVVNEALVDMTCLTANDPAQIDEKRLQKLHVLQLQSAGHLSALIFASREHKWRWPAPASGRELNVVRQSAVCASLASCFSILRRLHSPWCALSSTVARNVVGWIAASIDFGSPGENIWQVWLESEVLSYFGRVPDAWYPQDPWPHDGGVPLGLSPLAERLTHSLRARIHGLREALSYDASAAHHGCRLGDTSFWGALALPDLRDHPTLNKTIVEACRTACNVFSSDVDDDLSLSVKHVAQIASDD